MNSDAVQKYLFDLNGYLILEDVLSAGEVARLNQAMDEQGLPEPGLTTGEARFGSSMPELGGQSAAGFLEWGPEFCNLLDHDHVMERLRWIPGDGFRVDHLYGIHMRNGTEGLRLHGTAPWRADHIRRSLLFKYSPAQQSWGPHYMEPPKGVELTERQKLLFEKPYFSKRKSLFA